MIVVFAGASLVLFAPEHLRGFAGVGAVSGLVLSLPLLAVEYCALVRRSRRAASFLGCLLLYVAVMSSIGWIAGLLDVLHLKSPNPDSMDPISFVIFSIFIAGICVAGVGHLRWYRLLDPVPSEDP